VTLDGEGNVYFVDGNNNALKEWNASNQTVSTLVSSGVNGSFGVVTDGQGNFYIANTSTSSILKLSDAYLGLPPNLNLGSQAGTDSVTVLLGASIPLSATSDQAWLTITSTANGVIAFAFQANTLLASRVAHITVMGQQVTVTQSGDVPVNLTTSGSNQSTPWGTEFPAPLQVTVTDANLIPLAGVAVSFSVTSGTTGAGGTFSATPPMPILTNASGSATAPTLTANGIAGTFTVTASVNALTATFSLTNTGSTYALASSSVLVGSAAGTGTTRLIASGTWTASSNASWLQIATGSTSGIGSALIQFSYSANSNPAAQTGTLTIAGLTFTVTQAGTSYSPVYPVTTLVSSGLTNPQGVAVDGQGNLYIADTGDNAIKEWSAGTLQTLSNAQNAPAAAAVDGHGNVYIADTGNHAIEVFNAANNPTLSSLVSGLSNPSGAAVDGQGNVYFSDTGNSVIDEWNAANGMITPPSLSGLSNPTGVAVDAEGNVYFADSGQNSIMKWNAVNGLSTLSGVSGLNNPTGVAVDGQDNVYIADTGNSAIKEWNAGNPTPLATLVSTGLSSPMGVAVDAQGNIYIADTNDSAIKKLTPAYLALSASSLNEGAQAGTDSVTAQVLPASVPLTATSDQSWLTVTGIAGGVIGFSFPINTASTSRSAHITVLGIQVTVTQSGDVGATLTACAGNGQSTPVGQPFATALQVCLTDAGGNPLSGWPVTFSVTSGSSGASGTFSTTPAMPVLTNASGSATAPTLTANGTGGTFTVTASVSALSVTFTLTIVAPSTSSLGASSVLVGSAAGSASVLLLASGAWTASSNASWLQLSAGSTSGTGNALIEFTYAANSNAAAQTGTLTISGLTYTVTQAGASFTRSGIVTTLVSTNLDAPQGVAVDGQGNVYIADSLDNDIKEWMAPSGPVNLMVSGLNDPSGVAVDSHGNVYFADQKNNDIKEWSVTTKLVTVLVSGLSSPVGVAVDSQGNVYFSNTGHNSIEEWSPGGKVTTLVSSGLNTPTGVAVDLEGNVYIADTKNNAIKKWNGNLVSTLVNTGLSSPEGVAVDGDGNVFIADASDYAIKEWNPVTLAVTSLSISGLKGPGGVAVDGQGNVYIADTGNSAIKKYTAVYLSLGATSRSEGAAAGTDSIAFQVLPAGTALTATSSQTWLTIAGTTGGAISFSFLANTSLTSRTAQITALGQTVTITQSADAPAFITKTAGNSQSTSAGQAFPTALQVTVTDSSNIPLLGAGVTFAVIPGASGAGGTFSATPTMPILTTTGGIATAPTLTANGIGGTFTVTATVSALSTTFTLTNLVNSYLGASSVLVGNTSGSASVLLVTGGAWTATSNASWLQLSAGSTSGTGNALIEFTYSANSSTSALTGTLTIAGMTYTITQAAAGFTRSGLVTTLVSSGLDAPEAVAVDGQGNVYIADSLDNDIKEWIASSGPVNLLVSGLNDPTGVAVDSHGNVYFADQKNNAIKEWTAPSGPVKVLVSTGLSSPVGVAVDSLGNVYFSDTGHNEIKEWVAATNLVTILVSSSAGLNTPLGVAVDVQGNVYIADSKNNAIKKWSVVGGAVSTLVSSGLTSPEGVAVDGDGNVYIADTNDYEIKEWNPASSSALTILVASGLKGPGGVAVDGQGNVYIADTGNSAIREYTPIYVDLSTTSRSEVSTAGTDSVAVQVLPAGTALTATSNQTWLTITGVAGGVISFSFQANTSVNSRTAQITVLGLAVTVTQSGDKPASIAKVAGNAQTTPAGQAFATALEVRVTDASGNGVQGASVTFTVLLGSKGAGGTFSSTPAMPIVTGATGYATAPTLTANSVAGTFTVTANVGTLTTSFSLTN
jgi:sugar lactone lactonase YvrE